MDLNAITSGLRDSFEVEIIHPKSGEGGWFIELASPCHTKAQAAVVAIMDRARKRRSSSASQDERDGVELIAARILGWRGLKSDGEELPYAPETAMSILSNPKSYWIRAEILEALGDPSRPFSA